VSEPRGPTVFHHLRRAFAAYRTHHMPDRAAALTYFGMLSLFPGALTLIALLTFFHREGLATDAANYIARKGADPITADAVESALRAMTSTSDGAAGVTLVVSLLLALNGASGAFGAAGRALNVVNGVDEERHFVVRKLADIGWTVAVVVLMFVTLFAVFFGGGIADDLSRSVGLGDTGAAIWRWARWPLALLSIALAFGIVYAFAPDIEQHRLRLLTPGCFVAVAIWLVASFGFSIYLSNFSSYGAAYGVFGAAIALLLWLYIAANAFLFGAELDRAVHVSRAARRGGPPFVTPPPTAAP